MSQGVKAVSRYVRVSPRKARLAADLIRNLPVDEAQEQLAFGRSKSCRLLLKTLNSAIANAENNNDMNAEDLWVSQVFIDEGPQHKRAKSRSRGGRSPILKRTSHLTVVVGTN